MKYYKVLEQYDNKPRFKFKRGGGLEIDGIYIKNELYTLREIEKYLGYTKYTEQIELPKTKIYYFFGARFERGEVI